MGLGDRRVWPWQGGTGDVRLNKRDNSWWNEGLKMSHSGLEVWLLYWKPLKPKVANKGLYVNKQSPGASILIDYSLLPFTNAGFDYNRNMLFS